MADKVHISAQEGFKKGSYYDQYRPSYTDGIVKYVSESLYREPSEGLKYHILELGAGTGKFTKKIVDKLGKGCSYLATDPSESFLSVLQVNVPEIETTVCAANNIPLPDNSVQNIICAQCFHWFDTEESLTEMVRVLVPEGRVILVFNTKKFDSEWMSEMFDVLDCYYGNTPSMFTRNWVNAIEGFQLLTRIEHKYLPGVSIRGRKDFVLGHFTSFSIIARLEAKEREKARAKFESVLDKYFKPNEVAASSKVRVKRKYA